jgi:hypothetical protein
VELEEVKVRILWVEVELAEAVKVSWVWELLVKTEVVKVRVWGMD